MAVSAAFKSFDPNTEIAGAFLIGMIGSMHDQDVRPFLKKHGFESLDFTSWYSLQEVLDFFSDLYHAPGSMFNLVAIGMHAGTHAALPPELDSLEKVFMVSDMLMQAGHRNGDHGDVKPELVEPRHIRLTQRSPFPADLNYGTWYGLAKRFAPEDGHVMIQRTQVDETTCIFDITW